MNTPDAFDRHLIPNYYDPGTYYRHNMRDGVIHNRAGAKCCVLSSHLFRGLYVSLQEECGPAWNIVLRRCGEVWGQRQAKRMLEEIKQFYSSDLDMMSMARFSSLIEEYFASGGWGRLELDHSMAGAGIIQARVERAILGETLSEVDNRMDVLIEGVLKALFCEASGRDLECFETECIACGAPRCSFVIGLASRLAPVCDWLEQGDDHKTVLRRLVESGKAEAGVA